MKNHATSADKRPARKESRTRTVKAGSVTVRIYENRKPGKASYVVYWRVGEKPERKMFFDPARARFAIRVRGRRKAISLSVSPEEDALRGDTHDPLATAWLDAVRLTTHRILEEVLANT